MLAEKLYHTIKLTILMFIQDCQYVQHFLEIITNSEYYIDSIAGETPHQGFSLDQKFRKALERCRSQQRFPTAGEPTRDNANNAVSLITAGIYEGAIRRLEKSLEQTDKAANDPTGKMLKECNQEQSQQSNVYNIQTNGGDVVFGNQEKTTKETPTITIYNKVVKETEGNKDISEIKPKAGKFRATIKEYILQVLPIVIDIVKTALGLA
jgi:hypothetical protein